MDGGKGKKTKMQKSQLTYKKQNKQKLKLVCKINMYVKDVLFYIRMGTIW